MTQNRKYLFLVLLALSAGLALRLFFVLHFPAVDDDSPMYEELGRNMMDHHVFGLYLDGQLTPVDVRVPGYPAFLGVIYIFFGRSEQAIRIVQVIVDLLTCILAAALAGSLTPEPSRKRVTLIALWLAATCPFVANYTAVPLSEVLAAFFTAAALILLVKAYRGERNSTDAASYAWRVSPWFLGALLVGLGTLIRPETPLLLVAASLVLVARWYKPADWSKLLRTGVLLALGLLLPLLPWAARNWITFHRVQFLALPYVQLPGEYTPVGFLSWTKTWLVYYNDLDQVLFKLDQAPIEIDDLPASAFDSPEERDRVAELFEGQNETLSISPEIDRQFAQIARERVARHPLRTYLWLPFRRSVTIWFRPRTELLPLSVELWPLAQRSKEDPVDFSVTAALGLLCMFYIGLAAAGAFRLRHQCGLALLVAFIVVRTAYFAAIHYTPEPRFVVVCFPAVLALAALVWTASQRHAASQA